MKATLNALHHQTEDWKRELDFYINEIAILTGRVEEVCSKNTGQEVLAQVEHFQNKFIMLKEMMDVMQHDIIVREERIEQIVNTRPEHIDEHIRVANNKLFRRVTDLSASIAATRYELNRFLAKTM